MHLGASCRTTDLTDLVHVFDHDLRTPLTILRGNLELLHDQAAAMPASLVHSLGAMDRAVALLEAAIEGAAALADDVAALRPVG